MGIASEYVRALPAGRLESLFILATIAVMVVGRIALHLMRRYL